MTGIHAIIVVLIRLWAASILVSAIVAAPTYAGVAFNSTVDSYIASQFAGYICMAVIGVVVWCVAPWASRKVWVSGQDKALELNLEAETLVAIGSFLIGVFYLTEYVPQVFSVWFRWLVERAGEGEMFTGQFGSFKRNMITWPVFLPNLLVVVVASIMTFRPSYMARTFTWLRSAGHAKIAETREVEINKDKAQPES